MNQTTNARLAGFMFLFYIVSGIAGMVLFNQATGGESTAVRLGSIAAHAPQMRLTFVLSLLPIFNALILGAALYALTRDEDPDLALLALCCRVVEAAINAIPAIAILALLQIALGPGAANAPDPAAVSALGGLLLNVQAWSITVGATLFAVGSLLFSYLFLRARTIPAWLARLGVLASVLLLLMLPLEGVKLIAGPMVGLMWLPMLVFEVTLGLRLLIKGLQAPSARLTQPLT
jgi:hypothetical protein